MTKRSGIFDVSIKTDLLQTEKLAPTPKGMSVDKALSTIIQQIKLNGSRERTLSDYNLMFNKFAEITEVQYLEEITVDTIYKWLESMKVSQSTKSTRLKCLKAVLGKCYNNGWLSVRILVDRPNKAR